MRALEDLEMEPEDEDVVEEGEPLRLQHPLDLDKTWSQVDHSPCLA